MSQTLTYISTLVSLVSGAMTIFGIGGLLTWSLTDKKRGTLEDNVIGVMAATAKLAIAAVVLLVGASLGFITHVIVLFFAKGSITASDNIYWGDAFAGAHIAGYAAAVILWLPLVVLCVSSVFSWSLSPFVRFSRALSNNSRRKHQRGFTARVISTLPGAHYFGHSDGRIVCLHQRKCRNMPRQPIRTTSPLEDKVRRLEDDLYMARAVIIDLMQPELERLLWGQVSCKTFEEVRKWVDLAAESIMAISKVEWVMRLTRHVG